MTALCELLETVDGKIDGLTIGQAELKTEVAELKTTVDQRFTALDTKPDAILHQLGGGTPEPQTT